MVLGLSSLVSAEVKNFYINGVNNSRLQAEASAVEIQNTLPEIGKVESLHNTDNGVLTDFWEAGRMMFYLDNFFVENGNVGTSYNLWIEYKNHSNRNESTDKLLVKLATIYVDIKKRGGDLNQYIDNIELIRNSELNSMVTGYLQELGLKYYNHPTFKKVRIEDYMAAIGEIMSSNSEIFIPKNKEFSDLENMSNKLDIQEGDKFNFIAHSQGNSYMNRLARYIVEVKGVPIENIRTLSVATPENYVYPYSKDESGNHYITLEEDWVSIFFTGLPQNTSNGSIADGLFGGYVFFNISNGDISGHGFRDTYMRTGSDSREWIKNKYLSNYNELKALDEELQEDLWLERITLINGSEVKQGESIKFSGRLHYKSNEDPEGKKTKVCYAVSKKPMWDRNEFVSRVGDVDIILNKKVSSKTTGSRALNINLDVPVGNYFLMMKADCDESMEETSETHFQVRYREIKVLSQEKEDVYSTNPRLYQKGPAKLMIKNEMVYKGSTPDIGYVYNMYFLSNQDKFSTAQYIHGMMARMGYEVDRRRTVQRTFNFKLPPGDYYMWIITKTPDMIHDDNHDNNYFKVHFSLKKKE